LAKRDRFWREGIGIGEKGSLLAKRGPFWREGIGFGEKGSVLARSSPGTKDGDLVSRKWIQNKGI